LLQFKNREKLTLYSENYPKLLEAITFHIAHNITAISQQFYFSIATLQ